MADDDEPNALPRARRDRLFWTVCLPLRAALGGGALALGYAAPRLLYWVGAYAAFTALGLLANAARAALGAKTHGGLGGPVWWGRAPWPEGRRERIAGRACPLCRGAILAADAVEEDGPTEGTKEIALDFSAHPAVHAGVTLGNAPYGVRVLHLHPDDEAVASGLRVGDVITHVDTRPSKTSSSWRHPRWRSRVAGECSRYGRRRGTCPPSWGRRP